MKSVTKLLIAITVIATTGTRIPEMAKITFFDSCITKPLLLLLFYGIGFSSRKYLLKLKTKRKQNDGDEISTWPPHTIP